MSEQWEYEEEEGGLGIEGRSRNLGGRKRGKEWEYEEEGREGRHGNMKRKQGTEVMGI